MTGLYGRVRQAVTGLTPKSGSELYQVVFDTAVAGIVTIDAAGTILACNPGLCYMFGYQAGELIGADIGILMDETHARNHHGYVCRYINSGEASVVGRGREVIGRRKSGESFLLHLTVSEMMLSGDRTYTAIVQDLSSTVRNDESLMPQQLDHVWLGTVLDATPAAVTVKDINGRYLLVNQRAEQLLGIESEVVLGNTDAQIFPPLWAQSETRADAETIYAQRPCIFIEPFLRSAAENDAISLLANKNLLRDSSGRTIGIVSIILDVSSLPAVGTERTLSGNEYLNVIPEPVAFVSADGEVLQANEAYASRFGMSVGAVASVSIEMLETADVVKAFQHLVGGQVPQQELSDGQWQLEMQMHRLRQDKVIMIRGFKPAQRVPATRIDDQNLQFISSLSHELRTPLNAVIGFSQLLRPDLQEEEQLESLNMIEQAGRHLLSLVDQVMDMMKAGNGYLLMNSEPLSLKNIVRDCVRLIHPQACRRQLKVNLHCAVDDPWVKADPLRCKQILLNLLSNAVKYNRDGGEISVCISRAEDSMKVSVSDQGAGFSEDEKCCLFKPFERLPAHRADTEGNGLGLALSRLLARQMDGDITATSVKGDGSTFCLELPQASAEYRSEETSPPQPVQHNIREDCRILYIEDNPASALFVERGFKKLHKIDVKIATSGYSGLSMAKAARPEVVLLDMQLPDIHGMEVAKKLRSMPEMAKARIYGISANAMSKSFSNPAEAGLDGYLTKPFELSALNEMICNHEIKKSGI